MLGDTNFVPHVSRHLLHRGRKFSFERLTVTPPNAPPTTHDIVRHPGAVIIVPLLLHDAPGVVLIRNWRPSLERFLWELPAGTLEPAEDPAACAARELAEETGYSAATFAPLCRFHTSPGLSDELMHAFVATSLTPGPQHTQADEMIQVRVLPIPDALALIRRGELTDAKSILALWSAIRSGFVPGFNAGLL